MAKIERRSEERIKIQQEAAGFLVVVSILAAVGIYLFLSTNLMFSWLFGLAVGFILQRARICFTAALRDPVLFGMTELSRALILSLMITTVGFALLQYFQTVGGVQISGKIVPPGLNLPLGGFIFGLGAAVSGGCASGTLVRMGEGFKLQWVAFIGFILGSIHGAYDAGFWYQLFQESLSSHLPEFWGWRWAVFLQLLMLAFLYWLAYKRERDKFSSYK